jgi:hypothetical protein
MNKRWIVATVAATLLGGGCTERANDVEQVRGDWSYWVKEPEGESPYWIAALHGNQGWSGANSEAPPISLIVEWEDGDLINAGIMAEQGQFADACTRNGCYAYVRRDRGRWVVLRLLGVDDGADQLRYLGNPWALYDVLQAGGRLEIDIPIEGRGQCIYSVEASGYSKAEHVSAGPLDEPTDEEMAEVMSDGRTVSETLSGEPPDWVEWPICESEE